MSTNQNRSVTVGSADQNERAPLLVPPPPRVSATSNDESEDIDERIYGGNSILASTRGGDGILGGLALGALLVMTIFTWVTVLKQPTLTTALKYFAWHPPLQSLAVLLFGVGILVLQPIPSSAPKTKKQGRNLHQAVQGVGLASILGGSIMMIVNKIDHGAPHFTSWHGKFGLIGIVWIVVQVAAGGASVWFGGRLVGGKEQGKALWKYHRMSGYILFTWLLITIHLAGGYADWVHGATTKAQRFWVYLVMPVIVFLGVSYRVRLSKWGFGQ